MNEWLINDLRCAAEQLYTAIMLLNVYHINQWYPKILRGIINSFNRLDWCKKRDNRLSNYEQVTEDMGPWTWEFGKIEGDGIFYKGLKLPVKVRIYKFFRVSCNHI